VENPTSALKFHWVTSRLRLRSMLIQHTPEPGQPIPPTIPYIPLCHYRPRTLRKCNGRRSTTVGFPERLQDVRGGDLFIGKRLSTSASCTGLPLIATLIMQAKKRVTTTHQSGCFSGGHEITGSGKGNSKYYIKHPLLDGTVLIISWKRVQKALTIKSREFGGGGKYHLANA